jgi:hypothetical protein
MRLDVSYNLCSNLGPKLIFYGDKIMAILVLSYHLPILTAFSKSWYFSKWNQIEFMRIASDEVAVDQRIITTDACTSDDCAYSCIEDSNLNPAISVLLTFASRPDCSQNQTAVFDTLRLLSDF